MAVSASVSGVMVLHLSSRYVCGQHDVHAKQRVSMLAPSRSVPCRVWLVVADMHCFCAPGKLRVIIVIPLAWSDLTH
jgi:hypothetical protein